MIVADERLAILELYARYNRAIDAGDAPAWADCFTPDGTFHHPARPWSGTAELRRFIEERAAKLPAGPVADLRHWNDAIVIDGDGRRATVTCDLLVAGVSREDGRPVIVARGAYADTLVRDALGWRFQSRRLTVA